MEVETHTHKHTHIRYLASHTIKQTHTINHLGTKIMCVYVCVYDVMLGLGEMKERDKGRVVG